MERAFLVGVRLIRDDEGKVSPNSYASEDEMASNHADRERSTCQFCEQTFQVASTGQQCEEPKPPPAAPMEAAPS
jgi:hypothetical protein